MGDDKKKDDFFEKFVKINVKDRFSSDFMNRPMKRKENLYEKDLDCAKDGPYTFAVYEIEPLKEDEQKQGEKMEKTYIRILLAPPHIESNLLEQNFEHRFDKNTAGRWTFFDGSKFLNDNILKKELEMRQDLYKVVKVKKSKDSLSKVDLIVTYKNDPIKVNETGNTFYQDKSNGEGMLIPSPFNAVNNEAIGKIATSNDSALSNFIFKAKKGFLKPSVGWEEMKQDMKDGYGQGIGDSAPIFIIHYDISADPKKKIDYTDRPGGKSLTLQNTNTVTVSTYDEDKALQDLVKSMYLAAEDPGGDTNEVLQVVDDTRRSQSDWGSISKEAPNFFQTGRKGLFN